MCRISFRASSGLIAALCLVGGMTWLNTHVACPQELNAQVPSEQGVPQGDEIRSIRACSQALKLHI